jgi:hypothetical protein
MRAFARSRLVLRTLLRLRSYAEGLTAHSFLRVSAPQENRNFISRRLIMARTSILLLLLVFCSGTAVQAQAPKPGPATKKLLLFTGHWMSEGELKPRPFGPGGKFTEEGTGRMILNGFFLERRGKGKGPNGDFEFVEFDWYDPNTKSLTYAEYRGSGHVYSGGSAFEGNVCTYKSKGTVERKQYETRFTYTFAEDGMSYVLKAEFSPDGKAWTIIGEGKATKVRPPAKK